MVRNRENSVLAALVQFFRKYRRRRVRILYPIKTNQFPAITVPKGSWIQFSPTKGYLDSTYPKDRYAPGGHPVIVLVKFEFPPGTGEVIGGVPMEFERLVEVSDTPEGAYLRNAIEYLHRPVVVDPEEPFESIREAKSVVDLLHKEGWGQKFVDLYAGKPLRVAYPFSAVRVGLWGGNSREIRAGQQIILVGWHGHSGNLHFRVVDPPDDTSWVRDGEMFFAPGGEVIAATETPFAKVMQRAYLGRGDAEPEEPFESIRESIPLGWQSVWLDPSGNGHEVDSHDEFAFARVHHALDYQDARTVMLGDGWARISIEPKFEVIWVEHLVPLTRGQENWLRFKAEETDFEVKDTENTTFKGFLKGYLE